MSATVHIMSAETAQCCEVDSFGEWLGGELYQAPTVAQVATPVAHLPWLSTGELVALLLECGNDQLGAVRGELRTRYLATRLDAVHEHAQALEAEDFGDPVFEAHDVRKDDALEAA